MSSVREEDDGGEVEEEEEYGVLLYYKYVSLPDVAGTADFFRHNCELLSLIGRVRIAPDGVNVTIGGKMKSLRKHIDAVSSNVLFHGTDFKLASCKNPVAVDDKLARECGFTTLSIRVVKELVTLSSHPLPKSPSICCAGEHLSAAEFHGELQLAGTGTSGGQSNSQFVPNHIDSQSSTHVLLDVRNIYETRIGKFQAANVETLDPELRQYSDLPTWIDRHLDKLRSKQILMYCTGGIRCEMASAYVKMKGAGFENVYQLSGGIQRYLESFPDGGFFKGKNFVFDHRISVGSLDKDVLGRCLHCKCPYDDYTSRCRCQHCRMLVLLCRGCEMKSSGTYVCELCEQHAERHGLSTNGDDSSAASQEQCLFSSKLTPCTGKSTGEKLKVLCLHGFRQSASNLKGRMGSFMKKLKHLVDFIFIDAPHELPFLLDPSRGQDRNSLICDEFEPSSVQSAMHSNCKKRFAWLVSPEQYHCLKSENWTVADNAFDPLQYIQQTEGWEESYNYLRSIFQTVGPFDGILGFSQGASMAATLCAMRGKDAVNFRFAILSSGFCSPAFKFSEQICCPSLHIFGGSPEKDRQISQDASRELLKLFHPGCAVAVEHPLGHIIPTQSPYINQIREFLQGFMQSSTDHLEHQ